MAADAQTLTVRPLNKSEAARAFVACAGLDPEQRETPESAAAAGECFEAIGPGGRIAFAMQFESEEAWVLAAAGGGGGMIWPFLDTLERIARHRGCAAVGFQTMRPGLVRVAQRCGYRARAIERGAILEKPL